MSNSQTIEIMTQQIKQNAFNMVYKMLESERQVGTLNSEAQIFRKSCNKNEADIFTSYDQSQEFFMSWQNKSENIAKQLDHALLLLSKAAFEKESAKECNALQETTDVNDNLEFTQKHNDLHQNSNYVDAQGQHDEKYFSSMYAPNIYHTMKVCTEYFECFILLLQSYSFSN